MRIKARIIYININNKNNNSNNFNNNKNNNKINSSINRLKVSVKK